MKKLFFLVGLMMVVFVVPVYADTVNFVSGSTYSTTALTGYATDGAMMDGMTVTATFANGSSQTVLWADAGYDSGSAIGTDWSLFESGDTYGGTWSLTNRSNSKLTSLNINAATGDTLFDITWTGDAYGYGTDGSARGWTFERTSSNDFSVVATYSNLVALSGNAAVGDLFLNLNLNLGSGLSGIMNFIADTDNLKYAGDINPVPEPASMLLLGLGLVGLVGLRRKVQK